MKSRNIYTFARQYGMIGYLPNADMNVTTDQQFTWAPGSVDVIVDHIFAENASISLTTAVGGIYTAASKGGTAIVANTQVYSTLTAAAKFLDLTVAAFMLASGNTLNLASGPYLSLTTPQGAPATADLFIYGWVLTRS